MAPAAEGKEYVEKSEERPPENREKERARRAGTITGTFGRSGSKNFRVEVFVFD
jgi:hypothetical protein